MTYQLINCSTVVSSHLDGSFKEQEAVRHKQLLKDYEKQEKKLKELKNKGR